ncbi:spermidine synthase [Butyrivibrio sp. YAB3001]|uniref:spermidine synthase n=1 Tax=Butyrivibrio sp. YAB3001 TaxID=1520812 RepID=UPI0008F627C9|nr:fused MFS/spermidine synthase [Butyrivibrio sp. YAB3001]SFB96654.1 Spermine/spermidine synthase [Butyrivibrio sp. YAB3001]
MEKKAILSNKLFLYMTEFFSGMSVMAVELGASRLLAPYFSSSQIVWTIIIGTIMIAMALGNIYGGKKADSDPNPDKLYGRIIIAAIWIGLIPVLGKYIILAVSGIVILTINSNFLVIAAFAVCMIVFVFPLFLLGTVTPSLAKYTTDSLEDNGKIIGTLGAFNTIGSIIGTFVPTFVTIPAVGTAITFLIFAGILLILSIIYFASSGIKKKDAVKIVSSILIFALSCGFGYNPSFAFWEKNLTYEGESVYNYLQVKETPSSVILSTNVLFGVQSVYMKESGLTGMYYDYAMAAPFMTGIRQKEALKEKNLEVLILGMGSGTYATQLSRYFDNVNIEGVEIDDKITDLAHQYFGLSDETKVTTYDGRAYLAADKNKYDVIMVDAYQDITIPFQMSSSEFFTMVKEHLSPEGVMVVNMNMYSDEDANDGAGNTVILSNPGVFGTDASSINTYLADTISSVFDEVIIVDVPGSTNKELFATCGGSMLTRLNNDVALEKNDDLKAMMKRAQGLAIPYTSTGHIMTDDKAPVELLGMRQIDSIIKREVSYYKDIFKQGGIQALIDEM